MRVAVALVVWWCSCGVVWFASDAKGLWGSDAPSASTPAESVPVHLAAWGDGEPTLSLAAVGDILLDRGVGERIRRFGLDYPFAHAAGILSAADIAVGNLECPISETGTKVVKPFSFRARPEDAPCLARAGLDVLSLANNHTMDCGRPGLVETMERLDILGLRWFGAGKTAAEAETAAVIEARGIRVAFVGFCDFLPEGVFLNEERPTIAFANPERVRRSVAAARSRSDVVVASFHWGTERTHHRTERQTTLARAAVDAGACLVLGHHPHMLQRLEAPRPGVLVAYSLGNFLFDGQRGPSTESIILRCRLSRRGAVSADVVPVRIEEGRPRPVPPAGAELMLRPLGRRSAGGAIIPAGR